MNNGPAATIGEILDIALPRPRDRLALADNKQYNHYRHEVLTFFTTNKRRLKPFRHAPTKRLQLTNIHNS